MAQQNDAQFRIKSGRITRVNERPKVCFLTVFARAGRFPSYFDVTVFQPPSFPLEVGLAVDIQGELQMVKPTDGTKFQKLRAIARQITKCDDSLAPVPRRSRDKDETKPADNPLPDWD